MATELDNYHMTQAATRIEAIAGMLGGFVRTGFDEAGFRKRAEDQLRHLRGNYGFDAAVKQLVDGQRSEARLKQESEALSLVGELGPLMATITAQFELRRPRRDVSTQQAIMLSQERWEQAKELLDGGRSQAEVIGTADLDTLLAIEHFLPGWLRLHSDRRTENPFDPQANVDRIDEEVRKAIEARLVVVAPAHVASGLQTIRRAQGFEQIAWAYADHLRNLYGGTPTNVMAVGVAVTYLRREYGIDPNPADARRAANSALSSAESAKVGRIDRWSQMAQQRA